MQYNPEWFDFQTRVLNTLRDGDVKRLRNILQESKFKITDIGGNALHHWASMSDNLAIMKELMLLIIPPSLDKAAENLGYIIDKPYNHEGIMTYRALKHFLYIMTQPEAFEFYNLPWPGRTVHIQKIARYLTSPANHAALVNALSEVHKLVPLYSSEAKPLREYLVSIGIENINELIAEAINASKAAFERRAPLLSFRNKTQAELLAKWQAEQAMRESGGGGGGGNNVMGGRRRRRTKRHRRR